ncbi:hypothetical protein WR30_26150 [Burkholderia contaminans FFH2055]|uniref:hypothetical protein n=1 Tax=Burkholderia contaminans TaxID=488447 RepID=UPI000626BA6A|nr:hypothetical protein [Burkholderia contaminans]KKL34018.1 hypothetical protein WR30_26150 [Burkholderia contaminans FFH2055]MEB4632205.1 hypothetical protein [Burkholderia contaminans]MEB4639646.1 hypothetical protein [Burkholderia contaminans]MEB4654302.1 hypothetical protein [Burkholderia contaminans]MEB4663409.1 hypothetical protein [Burkholderia contaminans]
MIHYHGTPITPATAAARALTGGHAFVSFQHPEQLSLVLDIAQSFAVDNGAFSAWRAGSPVADWRPYYAWIGELNRYPSFDFAVIPDVIDGDEHANDALLAEWPWRESAPWVGAPVWHLHESLERLERLTFGWPRVCLGSSGEYAAVGTQVWYRRMAEAMDVLCDKHGRPICKIHGLRMLNPDVFTRFPFASADSTNIARNIGMDGAWRGPYTPPTKESRAQVMRDRIEAHQSLTLWVRKHAPIQQTLGLEVA